MKKEKRKNCIVLLSILFLMFIVVFLQQQFSLIKIKPLDGYYIDLESQKFSWKDWFSGQYQEKNEQYLNEHFGFRSFFVRLNHQIAFSLFGKAKTAWVTVGKENYLYEEPYIKAVYGTDFIGVDSIRTRMEKLKSLQERLALSGKNLIWVLAPGKGSFYPEYIPDHYKQQQGITNEEIYLKYADSLGINYIDFNAFFKTQKTKSPYPLYPQYGIHWSFYGTCLATDSIVHYVENLRHITMPHLYWEEVEMHQPINEDRDMANSLNLLLPPHTFDMGYPKLHYEANIGKNQPSLLCIGDSFFWIMYGRLSINRLFSSAYFWFYYKQAYPEDVPITNIDLNKELNQYDVILILGTNATLHNLGWGFIEQAYEEYQ
jgi:hypothetical protein